MEKVIITAAVIGSRPTREMNPAVAYTPKEIAASAIESCRAGAAIAHIHVRDPKTGEPDFKLELFKEILDRVRQGCDMLVNLTTSALFLSGPDVIEQRLQPVTLRPDICSLDIGSINFPVKTFHNPPEWGEIAAKRMREYKVKPEIEVFDVGHIYQALDSLEKGLFDDPPYFQLCMGTKWGIEGTPENLLFMRSKLPSHAQWSVLGVGRTQIPMITMGILLGGNVRVGFEDNIYLSKGVLAKSNAQMVEMAANLVNHLQKEVATPEEARRMLGMETL
jgi:3-keto-5-aminohexanoate cleavage enzyme